MTIVANGLSDRLCAPRVKHGLGMSILFLLSSNGFEVVL